MSISSAARHKSHLQATGYRNDTVTRESSAGLVSINGDTKEVGGGGAAKSALKCSLGFFLGATKN